MSENTDQDRHYTGIFNILGEQISGELIYNKKKGIIILNLVKRVNEKSFFGKSYGTLSTITGKLTTGAYITLFNNHCVNNHT